MPQWHETMIITLILYCTYVHVLLDLETELSLNKNHTGLQSHQLSASPLLLCEQQHVYDSQTEKLIVVSLIGSPSKKREETEFLFIPATHKPVFEFIDLKIVSCICITCLRTFEERQMLI